MEKDKKMNVLVIGGSGAGKTTLIKSIAGIEIDDSSTKKISVYESSAWPIKFIDTKGFEYSLFEQLKTISQIKRFSTKGIKFFGKKEVDNDLGIDAVWYCIEGTARRTFEYNIKLMNKSIKAWKNIPVFVVITKSYSETDIPKNIEEIEKVFEQNKKINLKKIIPVVAEEYVVNDEVTVAPRGIDELCLETINCIDEAKQISKENKLKYILLQKRYTAHASVITAAGAGAGIAFFDKTNIVDSMVLTPIEVGLTKLIFKIYGVNYSDELVNKIVGGSYITTVAKFIVGKFDKSQIVDASVAGTIIFVLGEAVIAASEAAYKGVIKLDKIEEFVKDKIQKAPMINKVVKYLEENKDKLAIEDKETVIKSLKDFFDSNKESSSLS